MKSSASSNMHILIHPGSQAWASLTPGNGEWLLFPSTNGHGTARGMATIYHMLSHGGSYKDYFLLSRDLLKEAASIQSHGPCPVLETTAFFGLGFQMSRKERPLGPNTNSFGHYGTGGSLGFADPDAHIGFGYVINHIIPR